MINLPVVDDNENFANWNSLSETANLVNGDSKTMMGNSNAANGSWNNIIYNRNEANNELNTINGNLNPK